MKRVESEGISLSPDRALMDPNDDLLGYCDFAENIARLICNMKTHEGFVIAIYGPWGSGKTTFLNFIHHHLMNDDENEAPIIVKFNPWWFSGHEDLTLRFFYQIQAVLSKGTFSMNDLTRQIADFADIVSDIPLPYASAGKAVSKIIRARQKDASELKNNISELLRKRDNKILVIIDDIDRLTPEEISQIFRVVKAIADFPNIIYLMAFDKTIAINALSEPNGLNGEKYLEKIIQLPLELPPPDELSFRSMFYRELNKIIGDIPEDRFDQVYWEKIYWKGLDRLISTPRDIIRLMNTLSITYPMVKGEVNPIDFIALESIKVYCPLIYNSIFTKSQMFIGPIDKYGISASSLEDHKKFYDLLIEQIDEEIRDPIKQLLMSMFPKIKNVYSNNIDSFAARAECRKQLRICSSDIFPIYFRLTIPKGKISTLEMNSILAFSGDSIQFGSEIIKLTNIKRPDGSTMAKAFIDRLGDFTDKIPLDDIPEITIALFDIGDKLLVIEDEPKQALELSSDTKLRFFMRDLLSRLNVDSRHHLLENAISKGNAITIITEFVMMLDKEHGRFDEGGNGILLENERLIGQECLNMLEKIVNEKIYIYAKEGYLLNNRYLPYILYCWNNWCKEQVEEWIQVIAEDDENLVSFIKHFRSISYTNLGIKHFFDPNSIKPYLEPSQIIDRIRIISKKDDLTEVQRSAINLFIRGYELELQGKNPRWFLE